MAPTAAGFIEVVDQGAVLRFCFDDLLRYAGPGSPAGVALAFQAMRGVFPLLDPDHRLARREVTIETAFRGPGARDGFELVTRGVTEGRYLVEPSLECRQRGIALEQFVFRFLYRGQARTLLVREGMVTEQFVTLARKEHRTPDEECRLTELKEQLADLLLANRPEDVFEVVVSSRS